MPRLSLLPNQDRPHVHHFVKRYATRFTQAVGGVALGLLPILVVLPVYFLSFSDCNAMRYDQNVWYYNQQNVFLIALGIWLVLVVFNIILSGKESGASRAFGLGLMCMLLCDLFIAWYIFTTVFHACFRIILF